MRISIVNDDKCIGIDGKFIICDVNLPQDIHAIYYNGSDKEGSGYIEYNDESNQSISEVDYLNYIHPHVELWYLTKKKREDEVKEEKDFQEELFNSKEERFKRLRLIRDDKLRSYDKAINQLQRRLFLASNEEKESINRQIEEWHHYANLLCSIPDKEGSPWDGGGIETPWPEVPSKDKIEI